MANKMRI